MSLVQEYTILLFREFTEPTLRKTSRRSARTTDSSTVHNLKGRLSSTDRRYHESYRLLMIIVIITGHRQHCALTGRSNRNQTATTLRVAPNSTGCISGDKRGLIRSPHQRNTLVVAAILGAVSLSRYGNALKCQARSD